MVKNYLLEQHVRDTMSYFSSLQVPITLKCLLCKPPKLHPAPTPALTIQSRGAGCCAEEPKADEVRTITWNLKLMRFVLSLVTLLSTR